MTQGKSDGYRNDQPSIICAEIVQIANFWARVTLKFNG